MSNRADSVVQVTAPDRLHMGFLDPSGRLGRRFGGIGLAKVPVLLIVGQREAKEATVSLRRIGLNDNETLTLREAMVRLETGALRSICSPVSFPPVEGRSEDIEQLAEAAAG